MVQLIMPRKEDYPNDFKILEATGRQKKKLYYAALNGSAMAYFGKAKLVKWLHIKKLEHAVSLIPERKFKRALDVGTGIGVLLPTLATLADEVEAIDSSSIISYTRYMVKKRKLKNVTVKKFYAEKIREYPDAHFDIILCMSTLEHITNLDAVFQSFQRLLARDGILIIGFPVETRFVVFVHENYLRYFRGNLKEDYDFEKREVRNPYEKTEGHVSHFHDIIEVAWRYFTVEKKISLHPFFIKIYYTLKLVHKK